jgi:DDE superfamily endonuclease
MDKRILELYSDYLLASSGPTTATGLAALVDGRLSHDAITRFLAGGGVEATAKEWWLTVKPLVRRVEAEDGVLIFDDTIIEKPHTDENALVCWHFDHTKGRQVKGVNLLTALYQAGDQANELSLPVSFELVEKLEWAGPDEKGRLSRHSATTKNERLQRMLRAAVANRLRFGLVLTDVWFASAENMKLIKINLAKDFIMPLKANRKVALSLADKNQGRWKKVDTLDYQEGAVREVWLEAVGFPLLLARQVFKNEDQSEGVRYLVASDTTLGFERLVDLYHRRWKVEEYHKSREAECWCGQVAHAHRGHARAGICFVACTPSSNWSDSSWAKP